MGEILVAKNIVKDYGSYKNPYRALTDINLEINEGDFLGIMGPSGSGKTTLLNILATIDQPTKGKVMIDGKNVRAFTEKELSLFRRNNISFIFQDCNLLDTLTLRDNIVSPLILIGESKDECNKRVEYVAKRLEIEGILDKYPSECSGGQRQRAAACRALITNPKIIVADEPTGALDTKNSNELLSILKKLNEEDNITIVMVTHDTLIASYCKTVVMIRDGLIDKILNRNNVSQGDFYNNILKETAKETNNILNRDSEEKEVALSSDYVDNLEDENERLRNRIKELEGKLINLKALA